MCYSKYDHFIDSEYSQYIYQMFLGTIRCHRCSFNFKMQAPIFYQIMDFRLMDHACKVYYCNHWRIPVMASHLVSNNSKQLPSQTIVTHVQMETTVVVMCIRK